MRTMRRTGLLVALVLVFVGAAFSQNNAQSNAQNNAQGDGLRDFSSSWTIRDLAASERVPVKKAAEALGLRNSDIDGRTLSQFGFSRADVAEAIELYREQESRFVRSIVLTGMIIVFASLIVVAFLISLLRHLHVFERISARRDEAKRSVRSVVGTITSSGDLSDRSIAAVVTAIFLHEEEVESENQLLLTWRRSTGSRWRTGGAMPNESHFTTWRGRS